MAFLPRFTRKCARRVPRAARSPALSRNRKRRSKPVSRATSWTLISRSWTTTRRRNKSRPRTSNNQNQTKEQKQMNVKPLGDRVLVQAIEQEEVKKGGIIIPDTAKEKPQEGKVVAIGTGKRDDAGKLIPFEVKKGDRVLIS